MDRIDQTTSSRIASRQEWLAARLELLAAQR